MAEDGPQIKALDGVSSGVIIALCLATGLFLFSLAAVSYCFYRRRHRDAKRHGVEQPLAFQTHRRPTAVKSPAGTTTQYLKKSPSPTGPSKTPPGMSPSTSGNLAPIGGPLENGVCSNANEKVVQTKIMEVKLAEPDAQANNKEELDTNEKNLQNNNAPPLGQLVFKLKYRSDKNALVVSVVRCRDLPAKDPSEGSSDPYVKLQLLPDKQHKVKTRVLRKTRNPVYDEDFTFYGIAMSQLPEITLHFVVLSFDRYSRDAIIGEVFFGLDQVDGAQLDTQQMALCREIQPRSLKIRSQGQGRGDLLVSIGWQPSAARLTVVVLKARNLPKMDVTGSADPYVKIYLVYRGQRLAKKKTHVKKRTLNPVFNESFAFDLPQEASETLDDIGLEFLLLDWDRVTKNEVIGRLVFGGPNCTGSALRHWNDVRQSPRRQMAEWQKLKE